eukprot:TRINITY_DN942_c0_g1_i2.p1 TRINITY_DN942_c0_g1~~TRINITY_DN942_c0_g1_i2.p1  ORF type:complete len:527 (+),score=113.65 TRINITY_DN942_c0_g1_i2:48-1583(+)
MKTMLTLAFAAAAMALPLRPHASNPTGARASHVLVLGLDGFSGYWVSEDQLAQYAPRLSQLFNNGVGQMDGRAYYRTDSKPNWAAFFYGAGPEQTGVDGNDWRPPIDGSHPWYDTSMFALAQKAGLKTAMYTDHSVVLNLLTPTHEEVDFFEYRPCCSDLYPAQLVDNFCDVILASQPELAFLHLDSIDHGGHSEGWGSDYYFYELSLVDGWVSQVLDVYASLGIEPLVIVTSDHGGQGTGHGCRAETCHLIPFILHGPGIHPNVSTLSLTRTNADVPVIALEALGVPVPSVMTGVSPAPELYPALFPPVAAARSALRIVVNTTSSYSLIWNDEGTNADVPVSLWAPVLPSSSYATFGSAVGVGRSSPAASALLVDLSASDPSAISAVPSWTQKWSDAGSGASLDGTIFAPVCAAGFVAIGETAVRGARVPPTTGVVCVAAECAVACQPGNMLWADHGSGADADLSLWSVDPAYTRGAGVRANTFRSMTNELHEYDRPTTEGYYCLSNACL